ncbi:hypothetical protein L1987_59709 [Smallanthus sonchifolius]|uniref:Uncharacterized protein n=1 Tax=Smallanthus sonchifolius TaxID=185202 RepID=A0ACB9D691_9ASTR|nr:hypothetical protein L1987_59709 [Smallanthus sonchifolius]
MQCSRLYEGIETVSYPIVTARYLYFNESGELAHLPNIELDAQRSMWMARQQWIKINNALGRYREGIIPVSALRRKSNCG